MSNSTPVQYMRVTNQWSHLVNKSDTPVFVANTTGTPVEFFLYDSYLTVIKPESLKVKVYTAGGSIGQVCVNHRHMYARAVTEVEDDVTTIVISNKPIGDTDVEQQAQDLNRLLVEIMSITQRLNDTQVRMSHMDFSYYKLMRYLVDRDNSFGILVNNLSTRVVNLYTKLFAVENYIASNKLALHTLQLRMDRIDTNIGDTDFAKLLLEIAKANEELQSAKETLEAIQPIIDNIGNITSNAIAPLKNKFDALNNAIINLSNKRTADEIIAARDELIHAWEDTASDVIPAINNYADMLLDFNDRLQLGENDMLVLNTKSLDDMIPILEHSESGNN